eukprot:6173781-Pleurochrysis_carterae.AAC.1
MKEHENHAREIARDRVRSRGAGSRRIPGWTTDGIPPAPGGNVTVQKAPHTDSVRTCPATQHNKHRSDAHTGGGMYAAARNPLSGCISS